MRSQFRTKINKIWKKHLGRISLEELAILVNLHPATVLKKLKEIPLSKKCDLCEKEFFVTGPSKTRNFNSRFCSSACQRKRLMDSHYERNKDYYCEKGRVRRTGYPEYKSPTREEAIKKGFRSGFEKNICDYLEDSGIKYEYESLTLPWKDHKKHYYTPDLVLTKKDGSGILMLELKGYFDAPTRAKMLNVRMSNPDADIRFVFQNPRTKLSKKSKTTYGDWAENNGFLWCGPEISTEWLNEI